jgi:hypothetical protein
MLKEFFIKNKQHVIIIALFMVISIAYCYPVLSGKVMNQNDDLSAKALNIEAEKYNKKTGDFIGWTNSMFSGMPTSVGFAGPGNYSVNVIYALSQAFNGFSFDVIFWCMLGMYIIFCMMGINPWLGALGSFIFAFSSYNILSLEAGHAQKTFNIALVPLLMGGIYLIFKKRYVWGLIATAFGVNYQIGMGHYQITYYAALVAAIMCVFYGINCLIEKDYKLLGKATTLLLVAVILGSLPNMQVLNTYYASFETTRGGASELTPLAQAADTTGAKAANKEGLDFDYATAWSYGIPETFTLLVPDASGGSGNTVVDRRTGKAIKGSKTLEAIQQNVQDQNDFNGYVQKASSYWGDQPFVGGPIYFGAIVCFLFFIGLFASNRKEKWWILAITIFFLFLAWGRHSIIYQVLFDHLPVFNKFRTPSMALGIVQIGFSLMAILGIVAIYKNENTAKLQKINLYTGIGFGALLLIMSVAPTMLFSFESAREATENLPDWFSGALAEDREALIKPDAVRSLIFIALVFLTIWVYLKGMVKNTTAVIAIIAGLIIIDLWSVDQRYMNKDSFVTQKRKKAMTAASPADLQIMQDPSHFRVFNVATGDPFSEYVTSFHHNSVGGYHGAKLRRYQELIERQLRFGNPAVLSMLNTKYIIQNGRDGAPTIFSPEIPPAGNAWFVNTLKVVPNADAEMAGLSVTDTDPFMPKQTLIVQGKNLPENWNGFKPEPDPTASIALTDYAPHKLKYESNASTPQVAVFSEMYYELPDGDGWKAYIDGQPAQHFLGDYVLRAMKVPAGKHTIEFKFDYSKVRTRGTISFVFMLVLIAGSIVLLYMKNKGKLKRLEE